MSAEFGAGGLSRDDRIIACSSAVNIKVPRPEPTWVNEFVRWLCTNSCSYEIKCNDDSRCVSCVAPDKTDWGSSDTSNGKLMLIGSVAGMLAVGQGLDVCDRVYHQIARADNIALRENDDAIQPR